MPARLINIKYITVRAEKVASPVTALQGPSSPPPKKSNTAHQILVHVCCSQTAGWIKMPLGTEVGLGPSHTVLHGDPAPVWKGTHPHFSAHVYCGQMAGWIQDATWYEGRPRPKPHCVTWGPSSPLEGHSPSPIFCPCPLCPDGRPPQLLLSTCWHWDPVTGGIPQDSVLCPLLFLI